jgi:hypothetical protein
MDNKGNVGILRILTFRTLVSVLGKQPFQLHDLMMPAASKI